MNLRAPGHAHPRQQFSSAMYKWLLQKRSGVFLTRRFLHR
jgi:hypothetical protein